jgi:hypothetical protein
MGTLNARRRPRGSAASDERRADAPRVHKHRSGAEAVQTHFWLVPES